MLPHQLTLGGQVLSKHGCLIRPPASSPRNQCEVPSLYPLLTRRQWISGRREIDGERKHLPLPSLEGYTSSAKILSDPDRGFWNVYRPLITFLMSVNELLNQTDIFLESVISKSLINETRFALSYLLCLSLIISRFRLYHIYLVTLWRFNFFLIK